MNVQTSTYLEQWCGKTTWQQTLNWPHPFSEDATQYVKKILHDVPTSNWCSLFSFFFLASFLLTLTLESSLRKSKYNLPSISGNIKLSLFRWFLVHISFLVKILRSTLTKKKREKKENSELVHHVISSIHTLYHLQKMDAVSF